MTDDLGRFGADDEVGPGKATRPDDFAEAWRLMFFAIVGLAIMGFVVAGLAFMASQMKRVAPTEPPRPIGPLVQPDPPPLEKMLRPPDPKLIEKINRLDAEIARRDADRRRRWSAEVLKLARATFPAGEPNPMQYTRIVDSIRDGQGDTWAFLVEIGPPARGLTRKILKSAFVYEGELIPELYESIRFRWSAEPPEKVAVRYDHETDPGVDFDVEKVDVKTAGEMTAILRDRATDRRYRLEVADFLGGGLLPID